VGGINSPVITYYTSSLESGDDIKVTGLTYPHSLVTIFLRDDKKIIYKENVTSNEAGEFMLLISEPFKAGIYSLTAKVIDNQNMESHETFPLMMIVTFRFISQIIDFNPIFPQIHPNRPGNHHGYYSSAPTGMKGLVRKAR
jgi:hypothetical protein